MNANNPKSQKLIVAVSGGVDSVVMLDMLMNNQLAGFRDVPTSEIIVAHFNHGIRPNSGSEQQFVEDLATKYGVGFETQSASLGAEASEELARDKRYEFLEQVAKKHKTNRILLAHHIQDVVETAILNIIRGSGRRGLGSLNSRQGRERPILHLTKSELLKYAKSKKLEWIEDESNIDPKYARNRIRATLNKKLDSPEYNEFAIQLQKINNINKELDIEIANLLQYKFRRKAVIKRSWFVLFDHKLACEFMHAVLNKIEAKNIDRELIEKLTIGLKVSKPGKRFDIDASYYAQITKRSMRIMLRQTNLTHNV